MLFVLTSAGQSAVLNAPGNVPTLGTFRLGSASNYIPSVGDTAIHGTQVHTGSPSAPSIESSNVLRYTVYLDYEVGPFSFGEVGLYLPNGDLFALGTQSGLVVKTPRTGDNDGNSVAIDCFIPVADVLGYGALSNSDIAFQVPRAENVDSLPRASDVTSNFYLIPSPLNDGTATIAFSAAGLWNFTSYQVLSGVGAVLTTTALTVTLNASGPAILGAGKALLMFVSGVNRGVARVITAYNSSTNTYTFVTPLAELPATGDEFIIYGYGATGTGGSGGQASSVDLNSLIGSIASQHLTPALAEAINFITAGSSIAGSVNNRILAEANARVVALTNESAARVSALNNEITNRAAAIDALSDDIIAQLGQINTDLAADITTLAAQTRGGYTGNDINQITTGLFYQEKLARTTAVDALSQQITLLSAGAGEQFDPFKIYYFDSTVEGWTSSGAAATVTAGFLRPGNAASGSYAQSPALMDVPATTYTQVRLRVRKVGTPTFAGAIWWKSTTDSTFDVARSAALTEPTYDANDIGLVTLVVPWSGTIDQIRVHLSDAQSATDYYLMDWVAIGRPSPGASSAALLSEQLARAANDSAEVTSRETLSVKLIGTTDPGSVTHATLSSGVLFDEKTARVTADGTEVTKRESLSAKLTGATDPSGLTFATLTSGLVYEEKSARVTAVSGEATKRETLSTTLTGVADPSTKTLATLTSGLLFDERTARSTADGTEVTKREALSAKLTGFSDPASATLATLSSGIIYDERQARVSADSAAVTRLNTLEATVNDVTTGVSATATALDSVELKVNHGTTGNSALGTRMNSLEATVNNGTTGVSATALALDAIELTVNNGTTGVNATATRTTTLEAKVGAIKKWSNTASVNGAATSPLLHTLTMTDGTTALQNPVQHAGSSFGAYAYKVSARVTSTGTPTGAISVFKVSWNGTAWVWAHTIVYEAGTVSNHVRLYLDAGVPKVRLYAHETTYQVTYDVELSIAGSWADAEIVTNYYTKAAADTAIAISSNAVSARLNSGGDVYGSIVTSTQLAQSAVDDLSTQSGLITALDSRITRSGGGNIASNPSFEQYTGTLNVADGWSVYNNSVALQPHTSSLVTGRTGGYAQRVTWAVNNTTTKGVLGNMMSLGWQPNTTYVLSFYARAGGTSVGKTCALGWNTAPTLTTLLNPTLSSVTWNRYAFKLVWGASVQTNGTVFLTIALNSGSAGYIEFDDVMIEQGDQLNSYLPGVSEIRSLHASVTSEQATRISQDTALGARIDTVEASLVTGGSTYESIVNVNTKAQSALDNTTTQASQITTVSSKIAATSLFDAKHHWQFDNTVDGWVGSGTTVSVANANSLRITNTAANASISRTLSVSEQFLGASYTNVRARVRRLSGAGIWEGKCYFTTASHVASDLYYKFVPAPATPGNWSLLEWDMSSLTAGTTDWNTNTILAIRIDLVSSGTDVWEFDWIAVGGTLSNPASAKVEDLTASVTQEISTRVSETGYLASKYALTIDAGGKIGGMQIVGTSSGTAGSTVNFAIRADKFTIEPTSGSTGLSAITPFEVVTSATTVNGVSVAAGVYMPATFIKTLKADRIEAGNLSASGYLQSSNFSTGASGWRIHGDGTAEFGAVNIRGRISASQISIQDFTNLVANGDFGLGSESWGTLPTGFSITAGSGYNGAANFLTVTANAALRNYPNSNTFSCVPTEVFSLSWAGKVSATLTGSCTVTVQWYNAAGGILGNTSAGTLTTGTSYTVFAGQVTAVASATRGQVLVSCGNTAGTAYFSSIVLRRAATQDLFVDGSLPGRKIAVNSIEADRIDARGLLIKDAAGNILFGAGTGLDWEHVVNQPANIYNNLVDSSKWAINSGGWVPYGNSNVVTNNTLVTAQSVKDVFDNLWQVQSTIGSTGWQGGYRSPVVSIDRTKTYRVVLPFIVPTGTVDTATAYFGVYPDSPASVTSLNLSTDNTNPYFVSRQLNSLTQNNWYFVVGFIYPAGTTGLDSSAVQLVNAVTGQAVVMTTSAFNWSSVATSFSVRAGLHIGVTATQASRIQYGRPLVEQVDGVETSLTAYLSPAVLKNSSISLNADGSLSGGGGGSVTITGLGYSGDLNATSDLTIVPLLATTVSGNTISSTHTTAAWGNSSAYSREAYKGGCYVTFTVSIAGRAFMVGLNDVPSASSGYLDMDFTWYLNGSAVAGARSPGSGGDLATTAYAVGDVFSIQYDGSRTVWIKNGAVIHTLSSVTADLTLSADVSFNTVGGSITGLKFGPLSNNAWSTIGSRPSNLAALTGTEGINNSLVRVGGTNLWKNSTTAAALIGTTASIENIVLPDGTTGSAIKLVNASSTASSNFRAYNAIRGNDTYSVSFYVRSSAGAPTLVLDICDANVANVVTSTTWSYFVDEGNVVSNYSLAVYNFVDIAVPASSTVYLWHPQCEYGNKASGWSPAVEDIDSSVAAAKAVADAANSALADIASDSILSPGEKPSIIQNYNVIIAEQAGVDAQANAFGITTEKTSYDTAVYTLTTYLSGLTGWDTVPGSNVAITGTTFRTNFGNVYAAKQALLNKISSEAALRATWTNTTGIPYETIFNNDDSVALGFNPTFNWPVGNAFPDKWTSWSGAAPVRETTLVRVGTSAIRYNSMTGASVGCQHSTTFASTPLPVGTFLSGSVDIQLIAPYTSGKPGLLVRLFTNATLAESGGNFVEAMVSPPSTATGQWQRVPWTIRTGGLQQIYGIKIYIMGSWESTGLAYSGSVVFDNLRFALFDSTVDNKAITLNNTNGVITLGNAGSGSVTALTTVNKMGVANIGDFVQPASLTNAYIGGLLYSNDFDGTYDATTNRITDVGTTGWAIAKGNGPGTSGMVIDAAHIRGKLTTGQIQVGAATNSSELADAFTTYDFTGQTSIEITRNTTTSYQFYGSPVLFGGSIRVFVSMTSGTPQSVYIENIIYVNNGAIIIDAPSVYVATTAVSATTRLVDTRIPISSRDLIPAGTYTFRLYTKITFMGASGVVSSTGYFVSIMSMSMLEVKL